MMLSKREYRTMLTAALRDAFLGVSGILTSWYSLHAIGGTGTVWAIVGGIFALGCFVVTAVSVKKILDLMVIYGGLVLLQVKAQQGDPVAIRYLDDVDPAWIDARLYPSGRR